jgi:hypothetical protein
LAARSGEVSAVAYVYFDYNDLQSQARDNIIRSLLKQLLFHWAILPRELEQIFERSIERGKTANGETLKEHLISTCSHVGSVFVLFDALDECTRENFDQAAELICDLKNAGAKIFCTSRIDTSQVREKLGHPLVTEIKAHNEDVLNYVSGRLYREWEYDEESRRKILEALVLNATGKFVYVNLSS